jgi:hypothetical protein
MLKAASFYAIGHTSSYIEVKNEAMTNQLLLELNVVCIIV